MVELSVDEAQRLARLFLTGQATESDIQRLQGAVADDQGTALELLAQMQAALDDSAPAGLNAEQDRSVNGRIEALIAPRVKKRGPLSFLFKLFRSKPKSEEPKASRTRRRGAAAESDPGPEPEVAAAAVMAVPDSVADDLGETLPGGGMEEMAPIAAPAVVTSAPSEAAAPSAAPAQAKPKKPMPSWLLPVLGGLVLLALVGVGVERWAKRPKLAKPTPALAPVPVAPKAAASPTPTGRMHRGVDIAPLDQEPLPAEFKATTPIASGSSNINP